MPTDQELLGSGVDPAAVATLQQDRTALAARENTAALDAIAPIISPEEAASAEMDKIAPKISSAEAEKAQLDAIAPKVDPLDIFDDATLSKDLSFDPLEHYIQKGGAAGFDAKAAARLGKIRKGQEANRSVLGTAAAQLGNIIPQVPKVIAGVAKGIASGLNLFTAPVVDLATSDTREYRGAQAEARDTLGLEYTKLTEQRAAEDVHGLVAETAGLAKGVGSLGKFLARKTGLSKDWKDMTDEEAFRAMINEGEKERELRGMARGDIPALAPTRERLAEEGVPVRPEKVQEATEHGLVGWLGFGTGIKLGGAAVKAGAETTMGAAKSAGLLSGVEKAAELEALRTTRDAATRALQAGPKTPALETALRTAQENFQAAETSLGTAGKVADVANRAATAVSEGVGTAAQNVIGRPIQAAGAATEGAAKLVSAIPKGHAVLGSIGGLYFHPGAAATGLAARLVAPVIEKAGAAVKNYGKAIAEGEARRTLDFLGAAKDVATTSLSQYPLDYAFSVGMSDTEQEARAAAPIATALGVLPGAGRGVRRVITGELVTPTGKPVKFKSSPAYGENTVLDTAHATAMKSTDAKTTAQINWVRELARKMGGRVYLMPDTQTFESTLVEVWKQQNPGAELKPEILAGLKQAADQQGMAFGKFTAADGELQPTVFIKNPEVAKHEIGHVLEKVLPEGINTKLDEQILSRLSPENLEAAGKYYANRALGQPRGTEVNWREVLSNFNPDLTPEQYLAREMRAENLDVALKNRGEAFATSPGIYRWLAQTVAKIGDAQGIPLAQSEVLGFPIFADIMKAGEKAAGKIFGDEAGQELVQARERRLKITDTAKSPAKSEDRAAEGEKATAAADELSARDPAQAEVLRKIASAISGGQGVKVEYRAAKGTPGADPSQTREMRRKEIEDARDIADRFNEMPEDVRPLWEKLNFPDRVESTKNKGFQIVGWSPENFAANAQKMAKFVAELPAQHPLKVELSFLEIDPATKSFTSDAWEQLYEKVQVFVKNQQNGGTGSGLPLKLPANAAEMRVSVPPLNETKLVRLNQTEADFINVLFNVMLPETPRVSRKGGTPGNIVAQRIARANEPVVGPRVVEPGRARSAAEFKGFPGERILETNPLRARMEQAASDAGVSFPSLIETSQRLNLDHIADVTPAPEAPVIRGVTDTLRAGFAPAAEKAVENRGREIASMDVATFKAASEQWNGGMTGEAQRIGKLASSPEDLASLQRLATEAQQRMNDAKKARDMDAVFAELAKKQFFDEAAQAASGRQFTTEAPTGQFAPKKKDEAKLLPAGADGMSKAWILPSGKIEQLGAQWHHAFLSDNPEIAKKYNLTVPPFEGNDVAGVREAALRKGFVRVNYGRNTGTLTVEARQKDWRHQKAAVEKLVEKNLDDIDNMTVHLLDETASKVVDSDSERLFRHDEDVDKMANLPFITKEGGEVRGAQFSPAAETTLSSEEFGKELTKIRAGQSGGQTFNVDGTVWKAPAEPVDVVTLASVNIPLGSAKPEAVRDALAQYEDLLNQPGIVAGVFAFSKDGKPTMSADINAVVPQEFRDNSFNFVKDNDQVSFWDAAKNEEVKTGGRGNTKLSTVDQLLSAQEALVKGEPVDVASLAGSEIGETGGLPGLEMGREFNQKAISQMSQAELKKHFPEAIVPRNSAEEIPYDIVESPLFKAAGSQEAAVKSFGRKLVEFYRENERSPELKAGEKWYSEFTPLLKKQFGKDAQIFAELLAATSPNTEPGVNFQFAFDALSNWKAGKYDKMIPKFNEGFERLADGSLQKIYERDVAAGKVKNPPAKPSEATFLAHWIVKNDLIPISSSGKRFGMHSEAVLKVLARRWLSQTAGPKTQNFVKNLVGTGHEATVDVWAARTMRRLGYSGSKERWRILPANSKGVSDADFHFSQEAFREAAKEIGIKPDALQGALWFAEKKFWSDSGWGRLSLGDFRAEMEKVPALKAEFARKNLVEAPKKKQLTILDDLVRKK